MPKSALERFWSKVDKSAGPDGCWLWTEFVQRDGYARFRLGDRKYPAHRVALEWEVGPCPPGLETCHSCRNRHCVNPAHLRWDTKAANQADKLKDGTDARGEKSRNAKLTAAQVLEIRAAVASGESQLSIARRFCVGPTSVNYIAHRVSWKHLAEEVRP